MGQGAEFFGKWASQTTTEAAFQSHPSPEDRAEFLLEQLHLVSDEITYFDLGVRFYFLGDFERSIQLLERFKERFPSREVLSDLGLARFQIAMRTLSQCDGRLAARFILPVVLDPTTLAEGVRKRGSGGSQCLQEKEFRDQIAASLADLEGAIARDPGYLPARLNRLSVLLVAGEFAEALTAAEKIFEDSPEDPRARQAKALAEYLFGRSKGAAGDKMVAAAIAAMSELRASTGGPAVHFNLARMLSESGRAGEATPILRNFLELESRGPWAREAREQIENTGDLSPATGGGSPPVSPIPLGPVSGATRSSLDQMRRQILDLGDSEKLTVFENADYRVVVEGESVTLVEEKRPASIPPEQIRQLYGPEIERIDLATGHLLRYGGFAFNLVNHEVRRLFFRGGGPDKLGS